MEFYIGTTNPYKIRELGALLNSTGHKLKVSEPLKVPETADNFDDNALLKALAYAKHVGQTTISEDSGLIVGALRGLPGPWSADFSQCRIDFDTWKVLGINPHSTPREVIDRANNKRVLELMRDVPKEQRDASFRVCLIVATPDGEVLFKETGQSLGSISTKEKGVNGFGYDPIFIGADTYGFTYAELDSMRKNLKSHRRDVVRKFKDWLNQVQTNGNI